MPIINVKLVEGAFRSEQKRELLRKLTDAVDGVYLGLRDVTFVTIEEIKDGDWAIAGPIHNRPKGRSPCREEPTEFLSLGTLAGRGAVRPSGTPQGFRRRRNPWRGANNESLGRRTHISEGKAGH